MDSRANRRRRIDLYTEAEIVSNMARILSSLGEKGKGIEKSYLLLKILNEEASSGDKLIVVSECDKLTPDERIFMENTLTSIIPYWDAIRMLSPSRRRGIISQLREALYGEKE